VNAVCFEVYPDQGARPDRAVHGRDAGDGPDLAAGRPCVVRWRRSQRLPAARLRDAGSSATGWSRTACRISNNIDRPVMPP
jgi:hypothetical protein